MLLRIILLVTHARLALWPLRFLRTSPRASVSPSLQSVSEPPGIKPFESVGKKTELSPGALDTPPTCDIGLARSEAESGLDGVVDALEERGPRPAAESSSLLVSPSSSDELSDPTLVSASVEVKRSAVGWCWLSSYSSTTTRDLDATRCLSFCKFWERLDPSTVSFL